MRALASEVLLALVVLGTPLRAQQLPSRDALCRADRVWAQPIDSVSLLHPKKVLSRLQPLIEQRAWTKALDSIVVDFDSFAPADLSDTLQTKMKRELLTLQSRLRVIEARVAGEQNRETFTKGEIGLFKPVQRGDGSGYVLFDEEPTEINVDSSVSAAASRHLCWTALSVLQLMNVYSLPEFRRALAAIKQVHDQWDGYMKNGYSRLPWELALNDRLFIKASAVSPPAKQVILLHPSVAFEVRGPDYRNLTRDEVALVEPLGMLFYNTRRTFYWGGSFVASFPKSAPAGAGFMMHLGKHAAIGHVWRSADSTGRRRNSFIASLDAYDLFSKIPSQLLNAKDAATSVARVKIGDALVKEPPQ